MQIAHSSKHSAKRRLTRTVAVKIFLAHACIAPLVFVLISGLSEKSLHQKFEDSVLSLTYVYQQTALVIGNTQDIDKLLDTAESSGDLSYLKFDPVDKSIAPREWLLHSGIAPPRDTFFGSDGNNSFFARAELYNTSGEDMGQLTLGFDETGLNQDITQSRLIAIAVAFLYLLVSIVVSWFALRHTVISVRQLSANTRSIVSSANNQLTFKETGVLELDMLNDDIKKMYGLVSQRAAAAGIEQGMLECLATDLISISENGHIESISRSLCELLGYEENRLVGNPLASIISADSTENLRSLINERRTGTSIQCAFLGNSGQSFPLSVSLNSTLVSGSRFLMLSISKDSGKNKTSDQLERIRYLATHDILTGLHNRTYMHAKIDGLIQERGMSGNSLAMLFIDLDDFKGINDTLGHDIGDIFLQRTASKIADHVPEGASVARLGGDEFCVLIDNYADRTDLINDCQALLDAVNQPVNIADYSLQSHCSIGIALYPEHSQKTEEIMQCADTAMYQSKNSGGNRISMYNATLHERSIEEVEIGRNLRKGIEGGEFYLAYQPKFDLLQHKGIVGAECLLRWQRPDGSRISPAQFIPIAERTGAIEWIGEWVIHESIKQYSLNRSKLPSAFSLSVNLSGNQLHGDNLLSIFDAALDRYGVSAKEITIELTEGVLIESRPEVQLALTGFRKRGCKISLDDFGTGYSSLSYLRNFDIDEIKIDRGFIADIAENEGGQAIVKAITELAGALGMAVVCEGIETPEQFKAIRDLGCDTAQGFLLGKPASMEDLVAAVNQYQAVASATIARPPSQAIDNTVPSSH